MKLNAFSSLANSQLANDWCCNDLSLICLLLQLAWARTAVVVLFGAVMHFDIRL